MNETRVVSLEARASSQRRLECIEGATSAGATEFVVSYSHGNAESLLIDKLAAQPAVALVRGFPRPLSMMEGIDSTFAGVIFIGYHTSTNNTQGVRAHTISSAYLTNISRCAELPPDSRTHQLAQRQVCDQGYGRGVKVHRIHNDL